MRSRVLRVTLMLLAFASLGAAAYRAWTIELREYERREAATLFNETLDGAIRDAHDLRAAQQAYVAAGQSETFWFDKVTTLSESLRKGLGTLDSVVPSEAAREALGSTTAALRSFEGVDRRARNYAATGQKLLASDIIFGDGLAASNAMLAALQQAGTLAGSDYDAAARAARREQIMYVGAGVAALVLAVLLLAPAASARAPERPVAPVTADPPPPGSLDLKLRDEDRLAGRVDPAVRPKSPVAAVSPQPAAAPPPSSPTTAAAAAPAVQMQALASVCTDLAKLADTETLPGILERTAHALDAKGLVLWVGNLEGSELVPVATYGYPASVLARLGTIKHDAENATAAAFRTGLVQTVAADASAPGAIAAPLVTPSGCRGVMSAEIRGGGEKDGARLAAASIVAAQLAALVGPPPEAASQQREAAI